ncbi:putative glutathione transferase [Lasiosphaeria hispida]|uniref:Glutathione transferase n=1 Tax=Lasiosphaeria hispida TaxID=260671 RepID=A0AAJ0HUM3_9PEZI|nr:putative glutathione transferase [Lasiosphaeria hispida]
MPSSRPQAQETVQPAGLHDDQNSSGRAKSGTSGQLKTKMVENPASLAEWRQKLFDLDHMVILSQEEFETYFPWVDNIYSHRSSQQYKRKPLVTHYWDCRMKGRPPGTPKSLDPNRKKRKRQIRERDLCDVKIKISEYQAGCSVDALEVHSGGEIGSIGGELVAALIRFQGQPFWTMERINGSMMNGTSYGLPGKHRHSLEKSDEIKKSSVRRWLAARELEARRNTGPSPWKTSGNAAMTAKRHSKGSDLKLYAACYCPFSQRVWIALEAKGTDYQYCETDPFRKPKPNQLLGANMRGLVPAVRDRDWTCGDSGALLEYLEEKTGSCSLLPEDPRLRAHCRLWTNFINENIVSSFGLVLTATEEASQQHGERLHRDLVELSQAAHKEGPFFLGDKLSMVDAHFAPFALRLSRILGWAPPPSELRLKMWIQAMEENVFVRNTTSADRLYTRTKDLLIQNYKSKGDRVPRHVALVAE